MNFYILVALILCAPGVSSGSVLDELVQRVDRMEHQEIRNLKQQMSQYEAKIDELEEKLELSRASEVSVAFSTRLHETTAVSDSAVVFGTVDLNIGEGYDEFTGVFNPPVDGVYLLMTYVTVDTNQIGPVFIKRGNDELCRALVSGSDGYKTMTCSAVATLAVGDSVRVTGTNDDPTTIGGGDSGFIGHIIVE